MSQVSRSDLARFPLLGTLEAGSVQRHEITLPGDALAGERWPVTTVCGAQDGPVVFINAGIHGGEYPAIETVIRLGKTLNPKEMRGTVVLMPVVNLPAFRERSMFVCPIDGVNPNRIFPGDPDGSYSEQLAHALTNEFIARADSYIDLHGGDIVEDLVPFAICRRGDTEVDQKSLELTKVFGLPNVLMVDRPVQVSKGSMTFVAGVERGVPSFIAEAGGVGLLQPEAVEQLTDGILRVLGHLGLIDTDVPPAEEPTILTAFEWLYSQNAGMFYPAVSINHQVEEGQVVGRIGSLFGDTVEEITSPVRGRVLFLTSNPSVNANGLLMGIGVS